MNKFYKFAENYIPPVIFKSLKNSLLYKKSKPTLKKIFGTKLIPQWNKINTGILKDYWLYFYPFGDWQEMMLNETYDKELFDAIRKINLQGKTIFDIGSHIGYHSIFFSKLVGEKGSVFAFEPNPFNAKRIKENVDKNQIKNIKIYNIALSAENSKTDFLCTDNIESGTSSGGFIEDSDTLYEKSGYERDGGFERIEIEMKKLDDLDEIKNAGLKVDILKIDVEGAESLVLEGAMNTIQSQKPIILIEIHSISNMYYFMNLLNKINYTHELLKREYDGRHLILAKSK